MNDFVCQAEEYAGRMVCGRCNLSWANAAESGRGCKPKADPPIGLVEMHAVALGQAQSIIGSQHAAVNAEFRKEPYMPLLRQAAVMVAVAGLVERVRGDKRILELLGGGK